MDRYEIVNEAEPFPTYEGEATRYEVNVGSISAELLAFEKDGTTLYRGKVMMWNPDGNVPPIIKLGGIHKDALECAAYVVNTMAHYMQGK